MQQPVMQYAVPGQVNPGPHGVPTEQSAVVPVQRGPTVVAPAQTSQSSQRFKQDGTCVHGAQALGSSTCSMSHVPTPFR